MVAPRVLGFGYSASQTRQPQEGGHVAQAFFKQWKTCFLFGQRVYQILNHITLRFLSVNKGCEYVLMCAVHLYRCPSLMLAWVGGGGTLQSTFSCFVILFPWLLGGTFSLYLKTGKYLAAKWTQLLGVRSPETLVLC